MQILRGQNQYDTPGLIIRNTTWDELVDLCKSRYAINRHASEKWETGWVCPMITAEGATKRRAIDVESMSDWLGLDLDHTGWSFAEIIDRFAGLQCIIYCTTNATIQAPRWRVLLRLSREMTVSEFAGVWLAMNMLLDNEVDIRTRNTNRLHYLPATWKGGNPNHFHVTTSTVPVNVDDLLMVSPPVEPTFYPEHDNNRVETGFVPAPVDAGIISQAMVDRYMHSGLESGRFFRLLCAAATRYRSEGWILRASDLANAALHVSPVDSGGMKRVMGAYREAERALIWIESRVTPLTAMEKMRRALKWRLSH